MAALAVALPACTDDRSTPDHAEAGSAGTSDATGGGSNGAGGSEAGASGATGGAPSSAGTGGRTSAGGRTIDGRAGSGGQGQAVRDAGSASDSAGPSDTTIAGRHPGDTGIAMDPDVVWAEAFEEGTPAEFFARYSDSKQQGFAFDGDVPPKSPGKASAKLTASGAGPNAVDFYKQLPDLEEAFVRYYAKYESNVPWHHTGVWVGGYNPSSKWPNPQAGLKPNGDDRFNVSLEPMEQGAAPRMDFYNYWMQMHSWMDQPMGDTAYYGNSLIHEPSLTAKPQWQCIELHIKLNPEATSGAGAELGVWVDDASIAQFSDSAPKGYWVKDKFCPDAATGTECTMYRPANPVLTTLDLQYRSTTALKINAFWPQNYITDSGSGSVWYDDMIVAKRRIGCIR
jgi:hypothetical protein